MRCDANVSLRPAGSDSLGTRTEMKNLNSISNVKAAIDYEIKRQTQLLKSNELVTQETRRWDAAKNVSYSLRSKEEAHDYRYFPDPDLMPVVMDRSRVDALKQSLPERPFDRQRRYQEDYQLPYTITSVLSADRDLSDFFEITLQYYNAPKAIANYVAIFCANSLPIQKLGLLLYRSKSQKWKRVQLLNWFKWIQVQLQSKLLKRSFLKCSAPVTRLKPSLSRKACVRNGR